MDFSQEQSKAITHKDGPMVVVAGPGSGKTTVLTQRVLYLIRECEIEPEDILVITFTKAAALEMQTRFMKLAGRKYPVTFGTFHSIFFRILCNTYQYSVDSIVREDVRRGLIRDAAFKGHLDLEGSEDELTRLSGEIGRVKAEGYDINAYHSTKYPSEEFKRTYLAYQSALKRERLLDFDDMLTDTARLFAEREDILAGWQRRYRYILIDEFQDINRVQYEVIRKIAAPENNLYIVGDDDQSIYGFRGSRPEIMLRFEEDYPGAGKVILDCNYRSTGNIVTAAGKVITHNAVRFAKDIHTRHEAGEAVDIVEFPTMKEENDRIVETLRKAVAEGRSYSEFALLYRTNATAEPLVRRLMEYNIPFVSREGIPNIFNHWIAQDLITYLKLAAGSTARTDFIRIMNKPLRYIGRDYLTDREILLSELVKYYEDKPWMAERILKLESDLKLIKGMTNYAAINYIRKGIGYDDYLKAYAEERGMDLQDLFEVADEIQESTRAYPVFEKWCEHIREYSHNLEEANRSRREAKDSNAVTLTTMHSSKGLEYNTVFIPDANEGITPHKKSVFPEEIEEERRMFYVAMTRAKKELHIYYARERYNRKLTVSRFVEEIMT